MLSLHVFHELLHHPPALLIPYRVYNNKGDDATGIYMNFLKLPELIVMPTFTYENEDKKAAEKLAQVFPGREIKTIYSTDLAKKGGIINCVTWTRQLIVITKKY